MDTSISRPKPNLLAIGIGVAGLALLLTAPSFLNGYWVRVLTSAFMYAVVTASLNLVVGFAGYPAFGNGAFFGVGAYVAGVLGVHFQVPFALSVLAGALFATCLAAVLGPVILRLRGGYFAIATVGIAEAIRELIMNMKITGGGHGLTIPGFPWEPAVLFAFFYYVMFLVMILAIGLTLWVSRSSFGYALRALRFEEEAAEVMGINTTFYKVSVWALSAFLMALAGGVWVYWIAYIEPQYAFDTMIVVKGFVMMLIGGMGTVFGPLVGAFFLELISELVWAQFINLHLFILGSIIVAVALFAPSGLMPFVHRRWLELVGLFRVREEARR